VRCRRVLITLLIGVLATGCTDSLILGRGAPDSAPAAASRRAVRRTVERGIDALAAGDHARASLAFNRALKLDPENSNLHLLNGLAYHAAFLAGSPGKATMAETGYLVALRQDGGNWRAAHQLGLLYLDLRQYPAAQARLAEAVRNVDDNADVYHALAVASYYAHDLETALWAGRRATELAPARSEFMHAAAVIASAAGRGDDAASYRAAYDALERDPGRRAQLSRRMSQWARVHERGASDVDEPPRTVAQMPVQVPLPQPSPPGPPSAGTPPAAPRLPVAMSWNDCVQAFTPPPPPLPAAPTVTTTATSTSTTIPSADETTPLPALPSPCQGLPLPRMALVDVTIVRTEETRATGQGVNLLDGLAVVLGGSLVDTRNQAITRSAGTSTARTTTLTNVLTRSFGLPAAGVAYSLNIASAADVRVDVIARPTLVALDRTPSNFFSGSNITIALAGQYGGNIQEKPIGVSLSVTPTFIDDETMLMAVKATRSFFESNTRGTFGQALATTRNTVTANVMMKFGQTLVISGMIERDVQDDDSGVPLLRDVPGIQYFFGRRDTQDFAKEVIAILTPRRPTFLAEAIGSVTDYLTRPDLDEQGRHDVNQVRAEAKRTVGGMTPNVTAIIARLSDNLFYHEVRTGDLAPPRMHGGPNFPRMLKEIREALYF
jgi:Tfp pilus assembly protein PilF